jgi:hypothetical protein
MLFMLKRLSLAILAALAVIAIAFIACAVVAVTAFFLFQKLAMPVPYQISGILGFATFYCMLALGSEHAAKKGFF